MHDYHGWDMHSLSFISAKINIKLILRTGHGYYGRDMVITDGTWLLRTGHGYYGRDMHILRFLFSLNHIKLTLRTGHDYHGRDMHILVLFSSPFRSFPALSGPFR